MFTFTGVEALTQIRIKDRPCAFPPRTPPFDTPCAICASVICPRRPGDCLLPSSGVLCPCEFNLHAACRDSRAIQSETIACPLCKKQFAGVNPHSGTVWPTAETEVTLYGQEHIDATMAKLAEDEPEAPVSIPSNGPRPRLGFWAGILFMTAVFIGYVVSMFYVLYAEWWPFDRIISMHGLISLLAIGLPLGGAVEFLVNKIWARCTADLPTSN